MPRPAALDRQLQRCAHRPRGAAQRSGSLAGRERGAVVRPVAVERHGDVAENRVASRQPPFPRRASASESARAGDQVAEDRDPPSGGRLDLRPRRRE